MVVGKWAVEAKHVGGVVLVVGHKARVVGHHCLDIPGCEFVVGGVGDGVEVGWPVVVDEDCPSSLEVGGKSVSFQP